MRKNKNFISTLHTSTKRNYLDRMKDNKVFCMKKALKFSRDYWDGNRRFGYGGYKYIPGRWKTVAKKLIKTYKLTNNSNILDVGCGKGFLLYEIKLLLPDIKIAGFDVSEYAIKNSHKNIKKNLFMYDCRKKFPYKSNIFDLVISINTLHNLNISDLQNTLKECQRVGRNSYIVVESFRNEKELFNLQCWALTCKTFFSTEDWIWLFDLCKYSGDYEFIYFE